MTDPVRAFTDAWSAVHTPPRSPGDVARARNAARTVAAVADVELTRIVGVRITEYFDWERLRVNVTHRVSPRLIRWEER